jgi:WD40 repeat protein
MRFLQQFSVVIMQNPLHIYASVLPFTPTESALRKAYIPLFEDIPLIVEGLDAHWPSVVSSVGGPRNSQAEESIRSIAFAPDGSRVALGSDNAVIRIWYPKGGTHVDLKGHTMEVTSVIFSPDGTIMASCSYDRTVCIWEATAQTMSLMHRLTSVHDDGPLLCVAFSTDGCKVAAGSFAGPAYVWDLDAIDISKRSSRLTRHTAWICSVVFLPENGLLASCSSDGMICIWDTHTLACIRQPSHRHLYGVSSITFSTCGSRIAICFVDGSLKFQAVAESRLMPSCMSQISYLDSTTRIQTARYLYMALMTT